ncbi:MAG: hypothetical protein OIF54_18910, partial [Cohaesibacter sp.]|nr:hypothetical protein [Cohaesibacter sp.]
DNSMQKVRIKKENAPALSDRADALPVNHFKAFYGSIFHAVGMNSSKISGAVWRLSSVCLALHLPFYVFVFIIFLRSSFKCHKNAQIFLRLHSLHDIDHMR